MKKDKIYVFDAYGTLFDVDAACRGLSERMGEDWISLSALWRQKQLEYSWLHNSMNTYVSFWEITQNSLDFALKSKKFNDRNLRQELLDSYFKMKSYEEVEDFLRHLKENDFRTCILSNGSYDMLNAAIENSKLGDFLDKVFSVEICKKYKPSKEVYQLVINEYGEDKNNYLFFSSNCWDIHGASNFGLKTVWVNRLKKFDDYLPGNPDVIVKNLSEFEI